MWRSFKLRLAVYILGGLLALLALLLIIIHTPPVRRFALKQAIQLLADRGIEFDASSLEYNLFGMRLTLRDVLIRSDQNPDLPPLLRADRVRVNLSLQKLLTGELYIEEGFVTNPNAHVVIDEQGRDNIPRGPEKDPNQKESQIEYLIDRFEITGGSVRFEERRQQLDASLPLGTLTIDGNPASGDHDIDLRTTRDGTVIYQSRSLPITGLTADLLLKDNALTVENMKVGLGESTIAFSGQLNDFNDPRYDFKANTTLNLGSLVEFAGIDQRVAGTVNLDVGAKGPIGSLVADIRVAGDDLTLLDFQNVDVKAEASYRAEQNRLLLSSFNVVAPVGTLQGEGNLALQPAAGTSTLNAAVRNLDLLRVTRTLDLPVQVASRGTARIAARWPGLEFAKASGDATVQLSPTRTAPAPDVIPISGRLNAKTSGNRVVVGIPNLRTLDAEAAGTITLFDPQGRRGIEGQLRIVAPELGDTLAGAEQFLGRQPGTLVGTPVTGTVETNLKLAGTIRSPTVVADVDAPSLAIGDLKNVGVDALATYTGDRVAIDNATVQWQGEQVTASGTVGLRGRAPQLDVQAQASDVSIATVLAGLNRQDLPVAGEIDLDARVTGTTQNPQGVVNLTGSGITAYNEQFGDLNTRVLIDNQLLTIDQLQLTKPQPEGTGTLTATGTYNLDTKALDLDVNSNNLRLTSLTLPDGTPVRGQVDLQADVSGTVENPQGTVRLAATGVQVKDQQYGDVELTAKLANQQADIQAEASQFNLLANANIGIKEPYPTKFEVTAKNTDLKSLPFDLKQPVEGTVTAAVRGTVNLSNAQATADATVEIAQADLQYKGKPISTEGPLVAHYRDKQLTIERGTIVAGGSRLDVSGTLPLEEGGPAGTIKVDTRVDLASAMEYVPLDQPVTAQGTLLIQGTITGTLKRIDPNINVSLEDGYIDTAQLNPPLANIALNAQVQGGTVDIRKLYADFGPASITASGEVPFSLLPANLPVELPRKAGPARFTADVSEVDLATIQGLPEDLGGLVSLHLEAEAEQPTLEALNAKLTFPTLSVTLDSFQFQQQGTSTIAVANGVATVEQFQITGPETNLQVAGTAQLVGNRALDLRVNGTANAALASAFTEDIRAEGDTDIQLAVRGTVQNPQAEGFVQLTDAQVIVESPRVGIDQLNARVELSGNSVRLANLDGSINGGTLSGGGGFRLANGTIEDMALKINANGVYFDFPEGLKTISDVNLEINSQEPDDIVVGGNVVLLEGGFTDDLALDQGILAALSGSDDLDLTRERNPLLERTRFNIAVRTDQPLIVDNNLAEAEVSADFRVVGTPYETGLSGRMEILEGAVLRFNERTYNVERGIITFTNERKIEPGLDILATTRAGGFDIRLQISGEPGDTETILTSDPPLPENQILAVLLTGRTLDDLRGEEFEVARNQVLSYLTGRIGSTLGRQLAGATGLSTVRVEPTLIANETSPGARLTVGEDITNDLSLVYSMDLINSADQIWIAEYDITRRFATQVVRQSDGSFRGEFRHDVRFGGIPEPRRQQRVDRRIGDLTILGNRYFTDLKLQDKLDVEEGDKYNFFEIRRGLDRIEKMYRAENYLESKVRLRRADFPEQNLVNLTLSVEQGPVVDFVFEGVTLDKDVARQVREIWQSGVFDTQRAEDSVEAIRGWLVRQDHLQPKIDYEISTPGEDRKRVVFDIQPGPKFKDVKLVFQGASGIEQDTLRSIVDSQDMALDVYIAPGRVTELLRRFYQEQGYLTATLEEPAYKLDAATATGEVVFPVNEGPLYKIGSVTFNGNEIFDDVKLKETVPMPQGEVYKPAQRERAMDALRELYWDHGFNDFEAEYDLQVNRDDGNVSVAFQIAEGRQAVVQEIVIQGNEQTSENLIRSQIALNEGDIVDLSLLSRSRRNLYNTGAYSIVDVTREEIGADGVPVTEGETRARTDERSEGIKPMRLTVQVREIQPFQLRYGGFYDTERGPGAIADISNRNSLGSARVLGLRTRYDSQRKEGRLYFTQPLLQRFPVSTTASVFIRREFNPAVTEEGRESDPFNVDRTGIDIIQESKWSRKYILNYGYRLENTHTYDNDLLDTRVRIGSLNATLTRETRDDVLDATGGSFMSQAIQFSPSFLGSGQGARFWKYFGQYFHYIPLQKPKVELFTNEILRPRLIFASGVRLGLAGSLGDEFFPLSEKFFAGGSNTIRGFEQNSVGPQFAEGTPIGGNAMLVINNELRFPLISIFDGVGFVDIGNVYERIEDISLGDLRKTAGLGLRVRTGYFLLRLDYGLKLDRRPGESRGRFFFSIGQAF